MRRCSANHFVLLLSVASLSACTVSPYVSCNVERKDWEYVPPRKLDDVDIEARRLVTTRSSSELLQGEVVQHWFKHGDDQLYLCRQSRSAKDFCFANRTGFIRNGGVWMEVQVDDVSCTK